MVKGSVIASHLLQMRGLKHCENHFFRLWQLGVASFTDAWIETLYTDRQSNPSLVASFTDAWIETTKQQGNQKDLPVASFTDAWIETIFIDGWEGKGWVASFTDAWIETHLMIMSL